MFLGYLFIYFLYFVAFVSECFVNVLSMFQDTRQLMHVQTKTCLDCDIRRGEVYTTPCDQALVTQKWTWGRVNATIARQIWIQG
jgi:hypothetical protein